MRKVAASALRALGLTQEEVVGRSFLAHVPHRFRRAALRRVRDVRARSGEHAGLAPPEQMDLWLRHGDGTEAPWRVRLVRCGDEWLALLGEAYEPLADRERAALRALGDMPAGLLVADLAGHIIYVNRMADELVGAKPVETPTDGWSETHGLFCPDERTVLDPRQNPLVRALGGERVVEQRMFVRNRKAPLGVHLACNAAPLVDSRGERCGAIVAFHDVTARHAAEQALEASRRWQEAILDNLPDIAWLKDRDGRFRMVNRALSLALNRRPDQVEGKTDHDLFPAELADRYRRDDEEVMRHGSVKIVEEPFVDGRGHRRVIETFKKVVRDDRGVVQGTVGLARDITERLAYEETLRSLNDELERRVAERSEELARAQETLLRRERLAVLGQLAGGVAHQIRNPLAAIQNATHVLERRLDKHGHADIRRALEAIFDEVRRSNEIITGLLDYARVRTPQRRPIEPRELVERVLAAQELPPGIEVRRRLDDMAPFEVDVDQIQGALDNLVRNALDAMPDGGALDLEVVLEGDEVVFVVADDGPGLSPQLEGRLFEPLLTTKPSGIGLGLVTARTLAEAHGGTIRLVDSARGARFELRLPAHPNGA